MAGVLMAFQRYSSMLGFFKSPFIGFENFRFLFATTDAYVITRNTVLYHFAYLLVGMLLAVAAALILSSLRSKRAAKTLQTLYMMPYFLSWTVVAAAVNALISQGGAVDLLLRTLNVVPFADSWYMTKGFWPPFLIIISSWKNVGYSTVLYLAVISGISAELYEAAMIDGATKFQQAWRITIPHLRFIITISLIMSMGSIVRGDFGLHLAVPTASASDGNNGFIFPVIDIIDTYIYRSLIKIGNVGMSAAAGLYQSAVGLVMVLLSNKLVNKIDPDSAMF